MRDSLEKLIQTKDLEENVRLLGFVLEDRLPEYYQAADLLIMPARALEGFGLSTIEALSCGTPVIGTPIGATPEVIGPLGNEYLCKDTTAPALANCITWWLERGIGSEVRSLCRNYCVSKSSQALVVGRLQNIFSEIVSTGRK